MIGRGGHEDGITVVTQEHQRGRRRARQDDHGGVAGGVQLMGFVRTADELAEFERRLTRPRFSDGVRLTVEFLTTWEVYHRLLPPLMEPADEPRAVLGIGRWQSDAIGAYQGGSISLIASHGGFSGGAAVAMWMDTETSVSFGRDVLGEPKKIARVGLDVTDAHASAWIERNSVRIIEMDAALGGELGATRVERYSFNYRSRPSVDAFHLDGPAVLTRTAFDTTIASRRSAEATVVLRSTPHDPVAEIEVVEIIGAELQRQDLVGETVAAGTVPAEVFLPYHYGRMDDPTRL